MYTLFNKKSRMIARKINEKYIVENFAVLSKLNSGTQKIGLQEYMVVPSNLSDYLHTIKRKAQIIGIKDIGYIIVRCGIRAGSRVVEGGVGSGSLTTALLYYTYPNGHVYTYEIRSDHAEFAKRNIERIEHNHWTLKIGDITRDVTERDVDAFLVDIPEPWNAISSAEHSLKVGGCFMAYVPTYNQMEKIYKIMKTKGFIDMEATSLLKIDMHIGDLGTRPENIEVPHTGFLVFGRKARLQTF